MPFAGYTDWEECIDKNRDKDDPEAYCGKIKSETEDFTDSKRVFQAYDAITKHYPHIDQKKRLDLAYHWNVQRKDTTEPFDCKTFWEYVRINTEDYAQAEVDFLEVLSQRVHDFLTHDSAKCSGKWITVHGGDDDPETAGTHVCVKEGQTKAQAIKEKFGTPQKKGSPKKDPPKKDPKKPSKKGFKSDREWVEFAKKNWKDAKSGTKDGHKGLWINNGALFVRVGESYVQAKERQSKEEKQRFEKKPGQKSLQEKEKNIEAKKKLKEEKEETRKKLEAKYGSPKSKEQYEAEDKQKSEVAKEQYTKKQVAYEKFTQLKEKRDKQKAELKEKLSDVKDQIKHNLNKRSTIGSDLLRILLKLIETGSAQAIGAEIKKIKTKHSTIYNKDKHLRAHISAIETRLEKYGGSDFLTQDIKRKPNSIATQAGKIAKKERTQPARESKRSKSLTTKAAGAKRTKEGQAITQTFGESVWEVGAPENFIKIGDELVQLPSLTTPAGTVRGRASMGNRPMEPVMSSNVAGRGVRGNNLYVQFHGSEDKVYKYTMPTPEAALEAFEEMTSGSPGRYVWNNLRGRTLGPVFGKPQYNTPGGTSASIVPYDKLTYGRVKGILNEVEGYEELSKKWQEYKMGVKGQIEGATSGEPFMREEIELFQKELDGKIEERKKAMEEVRKMFKEKGLRDINMKNVKRDMLVNITPKELEALLSSLQDSEVSHPKLQSFLHKVNANITYPYRKADEHLSELLIKQEQGQYEGILNALYDDLNSMIEEDENFESMIAELTAKPLDLPTMVQGVYDILSNTLSEEDYDTFFHSKEMGDVEAKHHTFIENNDLNGFVEYIMEGLIQLGKSKGESTTWAESVRSEYAQFKDKTSGRGKGWWGDPERHSEAAKKGSQTKTFNEKGLKKWDYIDVILDMIHNKQQGLDLIAKSLPKLQGWKIIQDIFKTKDTNSEDGYWITINADKSKGKNDKGKGTHLFVKKGETKKQAIDRKFGNKNEETKENPKNKDKLHPDVKKDVKSVKQLLDQKGYNITKITQTKEAIKIHFEDPSDYKSHGSGAIKVYREGFQKERDETVPWEGKRVKTGRKQKITFALREPTNKNKMVDKGYVKSNLQKIGKKSYQDKTSEELGGYLKHGYGLPEASHQKQLFFINMKTHETQYSDPVSKRKEGSKSLYTPKKEPIKKEIPKKEPIKKETPIKKPATKKAPKKEVQKKMEGKDLPLNPAFKGIEKYPDLDKERIELRESIAWLMNETNNKKGGLAKGLVLKQQYSHLENKLGSLIDRYNQRKKKDFTTITTDFVPFTRVNDSVLGGYIVRDGPFQYGKEIKYKTWDNIKEIYGSANHLIAYGSKETDSHTESEDRMIGYFDDFQLVPKGTRGPYPDKDGNYIDPKFNRVAVKLHTNNDILELSDLTEDQLIHIPVSASYDDIGNGNYQNISQLHHGAVSLNKNELDRCSTLNGSPCNLSLLSRDFTEELMEEERTDRALELPHQDIPHSSEQNPNLTIIKEIPIKN